MLSQFIKFLINGGLLGLVSLGMQLGLYHLLGGEGDGAYVMASVLTYIPLILVNFLLQRSLVFAAPGRFLRFVVANLLIMAFVSALSPLCRALLDALAGPWVGTNFGFLVASLIGATPSFLLSRFWVFRTQPGSVAT